MVDQVLRENREQNETRQNKSSSSLSKCRRIRTKLHDEFDAVSKTLEITTDGQTCKEMEQRLAAMQTSLNAVENSISKFENLIEDCRMVEEEACQIEEEEAHQGQSGSGEGAADIEMVDQEERRDPESSGPHMEADTEDNPPSASGGDTIFLEEEEILLGETPQPEDHSPRSKTALVQEGLWSYVSHPKPTLGLRRERPHNRSLPFSDKP